MASLRDAARRCDERRDLADAIVSTPSGSAAVLGSVAQARAKCEPMTLPEIVAVFHPRRTPARPQMEGDRARGLADHAGPSVLSGARVKRLHRTLVVSPALVAETPGARLQLMCRKCMIPRDLDVSRSP